MARRLSWSALALSVLLTATPIVVASCVLVFDGEQAADLNDAGLAAEQCSRDEDCVLAGPTCCDCPTYALPASSGWADSCSSVDCAMPSTCAALIARCDFGGCRAQCAPITCELSCPQGFAADGAGCLTCACNSMPAPPSCMLDDDCVEVPADCCGCARGGADTAVPRATVDAYLASLDCPSDPGMGACPDVSTCDAERAPRCLDYQCSLVGPNDPAWAEPPAGACGRADLPPCPAGQRCVLNRDSEANPLGLGVCEAPQP